MMWISASRYLLHLNLLFSWLVMPSISVRRSSLNGSLVMSSESKPSIRNHCVITIQSTRTWSSCVLTIFHANTSSKVITFSEIKSNVILLTWHQCFIRLCSIENTYKRKVNKDAYPLLGTKSNIRRMSKGLASRASYMSKHFYEQKSSWLIHPLLTKLLTWCPIKTPDHGQLRMALLVTVSNTT